MEQFADRLAALAELAADDLTALEAELVAAFEAADGAGDVELMTELADAIDSVREAIANASNAEAAIEPEAVPASAATETAPEAEAPEAPATEEATDPAPAPEATEATTEVTGEAPETEVAAEAPEPEAEETTPAPEAEPAEATAETEPSEAPEAPEESEPTAPEAEASDEPEATTDGADAPAEAEAEDTTDSEAAATDAVDANSDSSNAEPTTPPESPHESTTTEESPLSAEDLTAADVPTEAQPEAVAATAAQLTIRAGGDVPGYTAGQELDSFDQAIDAMTAKVNNMRGIGGDGEHILVASMNHEENIEEDRFLRQGDPEGNARKIRQITHADPAELTREALTAAGWCAPTAPIYDVSTIGTTDRPIRDCLPSFNADRGSVGWHSPPSLGAMMANANQAMSIWKETSAGPPPVWGSTQVDGTTASPAQGSAAAGALKPCFDVPCGTEQTATLEALTMCLCFDNLSARAFPEWIRANTELTMVAQARWAEQFLLSQLFNSFELTTSTGNTVGTPDTPLGAARDFLTTVRLVASQFRWRNRLSPTQPLQLLVPSWLRDAIADDLAIQMPGDNTLSTSYAEIAGYLADINVDPCWYIDDVPTGSGGATAVAGTANFDSYLGFPATAEWLMAPTGTFVRLDGGSLDLGVVRSKDDVQKNKYCEFSETFETVAYMGPDVDAANTTNPGEKGWVVRGQTAITIRGGYAPAVAAIPTGGTVAE